VVPYGLTSHIRTKQHTFAVYRVDGKELLFDNLADPYQQVNLAEDAAFDDLKTELRAMMEGKMDELGDTFEASTYYREDWVSEDRMIQATATQKDLKVG